MRIQYYVRVKKSINKDETQLGIGSRMQSDVLTTKATVHVQHVYAGPVPILFLFLSLDRSLSAVAKTYNA